MDNGKDKVVTLMLIEAKSKIVGKKVVDITYYDVSLVSTPPKGCEFRIEKEIKMKEKNEVATADDNHTKRIRND